MLCATFQYDAFSESPEKLSSNVRVQSAAANTSEGAANTEAIISIDKAADALTMQERKRIQEGTIRRATVSRSSKAASMAAEFQELWKRALRSML